MYLLTQHKKGVSALQLSRDLGVNYKTAWSVKHKLMQIMMERQQEKKLQGRVEMDDFILERFEQYLYCWSRTSGKLRLGNASDRKH